MTDATTAPIGISFRETMSGGFAMGEIDPAAGEEKGERDATRLSMHGTITIGDLDRFIADSDHPGDLAGSIDFAPLGSGLRSTRGVFNLFSPTGDPHVKYMVYEMGFRSGGADYYFAGHKNVRNNHGIAFWRDVTTLFTQIHKGMDKSGPVVAAGTISLSINQLIRMGPTFTVSGARSESEKVEALGRFGKFFLGEMWETYIAHE